MLYKASGVPFAKFPARTHLTGDDEGADH